MSSIDSEGNYKLSLYRDMFRGPVHQLRGELTDVLSKDHPSFLGEGKKAAVFTHSANGQEYAVKILKPDVHYSLNEVIALDQGRGLSNISQIVCSSREEGVFVTELLPGLPLSYSSIHAHPSFSDKELLAFLDTLQAFNDNYLYLDPVPGNFMYCSKVGISILDYFVFPMEHNVLASIIGSVAPLSFIQERKECKFASQKNKAFCDQVNVYSNYLEATLLERLLVLFEEEQPEQFSKALDALKADDRSPTLLSLQISHLTFQAVVDSPLGQPDYDRMCEGISSSVQHLDGLGLLN